MNRFFDQRPIIVAVAGPNGAGKTTFYHAHLSSSALLFINADILSRELDLAPYAAAQLAGLIRHQLVQQQESFIFETVFSDPVGDKIRFLKEAAKAGYTVVLSYIGLSGAEVSIQRVEMRRSQGGHDVPLEKLLDRYTRSLANLRTAIRELPHVLVFDNDDLRKPFRPVAVFEGGSVVTLHQPIPKWFRKCLEP